GRAQRFEHAAQVVAAGGVHGGAFVGGELVGGEVRAGGGHPHERAIVEHEVVAEEVFGGAEFLRKQAPEAAAADLGARAGEAGDGALGVFGEGDVHGLVDADPIAHGGDFAEGHAGLRHAEGAGDHAEEDGAFGRAAEAFQIGAVRSPGVAQGVVGAVHRRGEGEPVNGVAEFGGEGDERGGGHGFGNGSAGRPGEGGGGRNADCDQAPSAV